jgi:formylglycine-generating enzyme required for sulfatase activity
MRILTLFTLLIVAGCGEDERASGGGSGDSGDINDIPRAQRTRCTKIVSVAVEVSGFSIFKYEAVRPDASEDHSGCEEMFEDDEKPGVITRCSGCDPLYEDEDEPEEISGCRDAPQPACSEGGLLPWTRVTKGDAAAACERSGYRLCTESEWLLSCGGPDHKAQPYGQVFRPGWCNDHKQGTHLEPSGSREKCVSDYGAVDVLGNAWEWIADDGDGGEGRYLGYSYRVSAIRPTADPKCDFGLRTGQAEYDRHEVGFRCCKDL